MSDKGRIVPFALNSDAQQSSILASVDNLFNAPTLEHIAEAHVQWQSSINSFVTRSSLASSAPSVGGNSRGGRATMVVS